MVGIKKLVGSVIDIQKLYFDIFRILLVNNVASFPKNSLERLLIFGWIIGAFIINMFVQSKITSILAIRKYFADINTIEQLFSSGLPLYSIPFYIAEVEKKYAGTEYEKYAESLIPLSSNEGLMDQMIYRTDVSKIPAFLTEHDIAVFVSQCKHLRKNGNKLCFSKKEYNGCFFKCGVEVGVELSIVNALYGLRITDQLFKSYALYEWCDLNRLSNAYFDAKF
jgi:hypothetical protein